MAGGEGALSECPAQMKIAVGPRRRSHGKPLMVEKIRAEF